MKVKKSTIILVCEVCLSRNYTHKKSKIAAQKRIELKKFCKRCNAHTLHKETK